MTQNKPLNLDQARKDKKLDQFAKEQTVTGDKNIFNKLFAAMAKGVKKGGKK